MDNSIPAMALRTVVVTLPRPISGVLPAREISDSYSAISRVLIPRLVGQLVKSKAVKKNIPHPPSSRGLFDFDSNTEVNPEAVDVLIEVVRCFGPLLQESEIGALQSMLLIILETDRASSVVKKRAVVALSILAIYLTDEGLGEFVSQLTTSLRNTNMTPFQKKLYISLLGQLSRSISSRFGFYMKTVVPFVLAELSEQELDEQSENSAEETDPDPERDDVREAALIALDGFLSSCGNEMLVFTEDVIISLFRFIKYDPNYNDDIDEKMTDVQSDYNDDGLDEDDEFEAEAEAEADFDNDDDDTSWKVRRCAAKALYTIISTRGSSDLLDDGTLYSKIAPVLVQRFNEREESVRLDVIATMASLIRKTGEISCVNFSLDDGIGYVKNISQSRKRRRESTIKNLGTKDVISMSMGLVSPVLEPIPSSGPRAEIAKITPSIIKASLKFLRGSSIPTKQALINLLDEIVSAHHGGLSEYFDQLALPIIEAINVIPGSIGSSICTSVTASATANTLRIAALRLIGNITSTHSSSVLHPHLSLIIPVVVAAVNEKNYKISSEAIGTVEQLVKALTPPRSQSVNLKSKSELQQLYQIIYNRVSANDADLEVRQRAIQTLGIFLARMANQDDFTLLSYNDHKLALELLSERLKNETTRLASVHAIDTIAALSNKKIQLEPKWIRDVSLELSSQLRKANRSLRGASLGALKNLIVLSSAALSLDSSTIESLVSALLPLLTPVDLHLLSPALLVLAVLVENDPILVVKEQMNLALCELLKANLGGSALEALLVLVTSIASNGVGQNLMSGLLEHVNTSGDPAVVGKVIGTLLVYGGPSVGVSIDNFLKEIVSAESDDLRRCLALAVLGEAGLRLGEKSKLTPGIFTAQFSARSDKVKLASAVALGRAGTGNIPKFLPEILKTMSCGGNVQYLLLHAIKEIIKQASNNKADIMEYIQLIWGQLISLSQADDNKVVGAECIGRLAIINPKIYLPELRVSDSEMYR